MNAADLTTAVVLARGLGTRMRERGAAPSLDAEQDRAATAGMKAMIPVGRPFLDYVLSGLADAGYSEVCLVIGPEHDFVRQHYATVAPQRVRLHFALQEAARGTADAVLTAESCVSSPEFLVINGDNYYPPETLRTLRTLGEPGTVLFDAGELVRNSNIPAERVRAFAYGLAGADGYLRDIVEKPDAALDARWRGQALVSMNCWRFSRSIFDACRATQVSPRGELELTSAVRQAIATGTRLKVVRSEGGVLDLSQRADIPAVAQRLREVVVSL